ncbi:MAG: radical SAM protein, partial [Bacteroidales bacterium]|nr:radical SAM protein [Bacteroidales bacterium]
TNRECPFHCLMCDLWKNTTDKSVNKGDIPEQIKHALKHLPPARHLKLYNSGSFFDRNAIPESDYKNIASAVESFETLVVESHPAFIDERCISFRKMLKPELQVAMGLETVNEEVLRKLNKRMTIADYSDSVSFLKGNGISSRTFILLKPPFMDENEGVFWAKKSVDFAFQSGTDCATIIPVRPGNGAMDSLMSNGFYNPPDIRSLEEVAEYGIRLKAGRVFADLWDIEQFPCCNKCKSARINRLAAMNITQNIPDPVICDCRH